PFQVQSAMTDTRLPTGYRYAGVHCGIRPDPERLDLALIVSDRAAAAAGVFTQNQVVAAPVALCRQRLPRKDAVGIVICSGNANACTGQRGLEDARRMTDLTARHLGCHSEQVLVCSTGIIGQPLPMQQVESGIQAAVQKLRGDNRAFEDAAHAILTTDTRIKLSSRTIASGRESIHLAGLAKGAAMIGPNMATMLAFVLTDATVRAEDLAVISKRAADRS